MNNSLSLNASKLDLQTLEELRDPNLISRYPPLFQRKQTFLDISNNDNYKKHYSSSGKSKKQSSKLKEIKSQQFSSLTPSTSSKNSNDERKPRRGFTAFLKTFSKEARKLERQETLKKSISKPILQSNNTAAQNYKTTTQNKEAIYTHSMYPSKTKRSFKIKEDSHTGSSNSNHEMSSSSFVNHYKQSDHRNKKAISPLRANIPISPTDLSAMNSIIIPPVGSSQNIGNPEHYSSSIVHPNMTFRKNTNSDSFGRNNISFARFDMMNLDNNAAYSPMDVEETEYSSAQINPYEQINDIMIPTSMFLPTSSDSEDSFYSLNDNEKIDLSNKYNQIHEKSNKQPRLHSHSNSHQTHVHSPAYRFTKSSSNRQKYKSNTNYNARERRA
ncbi:hypothetical protein KGF54_002413 [Candida jiufengensis]|uniref:uncharacterized protein n=1 Tax=Candida jiufengensis TaxID=497108 RepID=UPI0022254E1A|nr:uncharacterized protein KGF54_002413 [Candida jiufengensis]KAI5954637.1 hypothetical protein KGF54_002413 [Candida jiufengensis]